MTRKMINYITIREDYSVYECENGQILRVKTTISNIYDDDQSKKTGIDFKDISSVTTLTPIDTTEYEESTPEQVTAEHEIRTLKFKSLKQIINIYETEKSLIVLYPVIENIYLTNKKDKQGDPILRYLAKNSLNVIDKKMFIEGPPDSQPSSTS
jgi:hypothetical protein